jgi:hypothetical protein
MMAFSLCMRLGSASPEVSALALSVVALSIAVFNAGTRLPAHPRGNGLRGLFHCGGYTNPPSATIFCKEGHVLCVILFSGLEA